MLTDGWKKPTDRDRDDTRPEPQQEARATLASPLRALRSSGSRRRCAWSSPAFYIAQPAHQLRHRDRGTGPMQKPEVYDRRPRRSKLSSVDFCTSPSAAKSARTLVVRKMSLRGTPEARNPLADRSLIFVALRCVDMAVAQPQRFGHYFGARFSTQSPRATPNDSGDGDLPFAGLRCNRGYPTRSGPGPDRRSDQRLAQDVGEISPSGIWSASMWSRASLLSARRPVMDAERPRHPHIERRRVRRGRT